MRVCLQNTFTPEERERYARHFQLPGFGEEAQRRLRSASVLVVGAGGLGSPAIQYLAAAGVGRIGIADFDRVERSNLHRQVLFGEADLGKSKSAVACERVRMLNPNVVADDIAEQITEANAREIIEPYDVVLDGTDNFATRYVLNDASVFLDKPLVHGSVYRNEAQVSVFGGSGGPCYRCLFPDPPPPHLVPSCAEGGVLGILPGIVGSLQALEVIKLLAGIGEPLRGRTLQFDALSATFHEYRFEPRVGCVCGPDSLARRHTNTTEPHPSEAASTNMIPEIQPAELSQRIESGDAPRLLDVRAPQEHEADNIGGTLVPLDQFEAYVASGQLPADEEIVVYCHSGRRSAAAVQYLRQHGYENVRNLVGGIVRWRQEMGPVSGER